jgi:hypothetical protein
MLLDILRNRVEKIPLYLNTLNPSDMWGHITEMGSSLVSPIRNPHAAATSNPESIPVCLGFLPAFGP